MRKIRICSVTAVVLALFLPLKGTTAMRPVLKKKAGLPPFTVVKELARGNDGRSPAGEGSPVCAWLADSSPDLTPDRILANPIGQMLIARNPEAKMTREATRILDTAIKKLHLPVLLISRSSEERYLAAISSRPLPKSIAGRRTMLEKAVDTLVEKAVARYRKRVKSGRLVVIGSIFDQANWYGRGHGRLLLININGEKDDRGLRAHQAVVLLSADERRQHLGRHREGDR